MKILEKYNYERIRIGIASPEQIFAWSYGEVLKPETINYRTLRLKRMVFSANASLAPRRNGNVSVGSLRAFVIRGWNVTGVG